MTTPTPPPTPYDHKPAYDWAAAMCERMARSGADPALEIEWALVEAYMAGRAAALEEEREACAKAAEDAIANGVVVLSAGEVADFIRSRR